MNYTYKVYYTVLCEVPANQHKDRDMVITAPNPIRAIDVFHRNVQTMKPLLKAEDYQVTSMVQRYKDTPVALGGTGGWIEAKVDLPASPNPVIGQRIISAAALQTEMPLDDARKVETRSHEHAES